MSADAETDPLARADALFAEIGGPSMAPEQGLFGVIADDLDTVYGNVYTAELVIRHRPEQARRALFLLAANWGINRVAKTVKLGTRTVMALRDLFPEKVATAKAQLAQMMTDAAWLQVERCMENPDSIKIDNAPMAAKLLLDGAAQLRGDALPVQRHIHAHYTADQLAELAAGMGLDAQEISALPAPALAPAPAHTSALFRDDESLDLSCSKQHEATLAPCLPPTGGEGVPPPMPGGGSPDVLPGS